ncbi:MAG: hypothetical protein RLZZ28_377 [Bacteroidota bacterium]
MYRVIYYNLQLPVIFSQSKELLAFGPSITVYSTSICVDICQLLLINTRDSKRLRL